jgi:hypothetical protein
VRQNIARLLSRFCEKRTQDDEYHGAQSSNQLAANNSRNTLPAILDVNRCSFLAALGGAGATY